MQNNILMQGSQSLSVRSTFYLPLRSSVRLALRLTVALLLTGLFFHSHCYGHEGRPVFIDLSETQDGHYTLRWKIPPVMSPGSEPKISLQGTGCKPVSIQYRVSLTGSSLFTCQKDQQDSLKIKIAYPNNNPVLSSLIQFTKLSGESYSLFNGPDILNISLPKKVSFLQVSQQYIEAGLFHILEGFDHLLFVLCLMQIAGGIKRILLTISGFTLAHSVTLALASLELINVRIDIVEVLIALSIVMLAVEMVKGSKQQQKSSLIWRYPVSVASLFGLLHGLGFASALGELGLPQEMKLPALIFFNVGVELGQILFIAVMFILLVGLKKIGIEKAFGKLPEFFYFSPFTQSHSGQPNTTQTNTAQSSVISSMKQGNALTTAQFPMPVIYIIGAVSGYWFIESVFSMFT